MDKPAVSLSPGRLAWLRLRSNYLAMTALVVVVVVSLATIAAPLLAPMDPDRTHTWIGAQPPGAVHPNCLDINILHVGEKAEIPAGLSHGHTVQYTVKTRERIDYRILLKRDGTVSYIQLVEGRMNVDRLTISADDGATTKDGRALVSAEVVAGEPPPDQWFIGDNRVLQMSAFGPALSEIIEAQLSDAGEVESLQRDGVAIQTMVIHGENVSQIVVDGEEKTIYHLLGTDAQGRDVLSRILYGGQISLMVAAVATAVSLLIGILYGAISGFCGGRVDRWMMASVDVLYALPFMFLVILLMAVFGRSLLLLFAALGAVQWLTTARIVRGQVLSLMGREFIAAAKLSGASPWRIIVRHLIPNCLGPVVIYATLTIPAVILQESFLSFLGLGVSFAGTQIESWGGLVKTGAEAMTTHPWLLFAPATMMAVTLLAFNALGDGVRDALDPSLEGR